MRFLNNISGLENLKDSGTQLSPAKLEHLVMKNEQEQTF